MCWESVLSPLHINTSEQGLLRNPVPQIPLPGICPAHSKEAELKQKSQMTMFNVKKTKQNKMKEKYMDHFNASVVTESTPPPPK